MNRLILTAAACVVAVTSLSAQVINDEYLRTAPSSTETVSTAALQTWSAPGSPETSVWVKSPSGTITQVPVFQLSAWMAFSGESGTFSLLYLLPGSVYYRHDVVVS